MDGRSFAALRMTSRGAVPFYTLLERTSIRTIVRYAIVIEKADENYSAYVPDLPGCVSTGRTVEEVKQNIAEAIQFHIQGLIEDGDPIPPPNPLSDYVETKVA